MQALIFPDRLEQLPLRSQQRLERRILGCQLRGESVATAASAGYFDLQGTARHGVKVAALFVARNGCYFGIEGVDPWDEERDARRYEGPEPVVAHPPCERWGRYWSGGPSARVRREKGDDAGCFVSALASVRRWGGVLEHPEASHAWRAHGLNAPPKSGAWISADFFGGWTCCVEQGHYGHRARKATWLYAHGVSLPSLKWGPCARRARLDEGFHSAEERAFRSNRSLSPEMRLRKSQWMTAVEQATGVKDFRRLTLTECKATPPEFRDLLIGIARTARRETP